MINDESTSPSAPRLDGWFWLIVILTTAIVLPRSISVTRAHSPSADDQFHLRRGLHYLTGEPPGLILTPFDGPLGQAIDALPMVLGGNSMAEPIHFENMPYRAVNLPAKPNAAQQFAMAARRDVLFGHAISPDALLMRIAIFKAVLFIPFAALVFYWSRWLYGLRAGFVAISLLLIDPTFAAHIPVAAIDVLGVEMIVFACFALWIWARHPSWPTLVVAAALSAGAMLTKQTAAIMPVVAVGYVGVVWLRQRWSGTCCEPIRKTFDRLLRYFLLLAVLIWLVMKCDFSRPGDFVDPIYSAVPGHFSVTADVLYPVLQYRWPAGKYLAAFVNSVRVDTAGRWAFLLGRARVGGWWFYYPVLLALKAPLGFFVIFLLALISLRVRRPFFDEWSLLLPVILWVALLMDSQVNIGFRHFLPAYVFILMLGSRAVVRVAETLFGKITSFVVWLALAASAFNVLAWHPDYLSYVNLPYSQPWLLMNDSNIDWGQGLKQTRDWLDQHPSGDRAVYVRYDWDPVWVDYYLHGRAKRITQFEAPPTHGILIICPVWIAGYWDPGDAYAFLRADRPMAIIGHSMLVYDLDHLSNAPRMHP